MLVNNIEKKSPIVLGGVLFAVLAAMVAMMPMVAPTLDIAYVAGVQYSKAAWALNLVFQVSSLAGFLAVVGGPLAMAVRYIGFWALRRMVKRIGFRRTAQY
jgi:hypothetical protein